MKRLVLLLGLVPTLAPVHPSGAQGWVNLQRPTSADTTLHLFSPRTALVSGIVFPGAGQAYVGEWGRGYNYFRFTLGFGLISLLAYEFNKCTFYFSSENPCSPAEQRGMKAAGAIFGAGALTSWALGAIDAPRAARRINEDRLARRGWGITRVGAGPYLDVGRNGALLAGVSLTQ